MADLVLVRLKYIVATVFTSLLVVGCVAGLQLNKKILYYIAPLYYNRTAFSAATCHFVNAYKLQLKLCSTNFNFTCTG